MLAVDSLIFDHSPLSCKPRFAGAEALTQALPHCKKLVVLEMLCCGLGDEAARSLAKNLPSCVAVFLLYVCVCLMRVILIGMLMLWAGLYRFRDFLQDEVRTRRTPVQGTSLQNAYG